MLAALAAADTARAETFAAKNDLEAFILATGERIATEESVRLVSTEQQRDALQAALTAAEDWLYMDGADEPAAVFRWVLTQHPTSDLLFNLTGASCNMALLVDCCLRLQLASLTIQGVLLCHLPDQ